MRRVDPSAMKRFAAAARAQGQVAGLTHNFYAYPARFSPQFAAVAISSFSKPGDLVLDPYVGGGTTVIEAMASGRRAIGSDINQLSIFVTSAKVCPLTNAERQEIISWATRQVPYMRCNHQLISTGVRPRNMSLPDTRWIHKIIGLILESIDAELSTAVARRFARCVLLNAGQWALHGRKTVPTVSEFRARVSRVTLTMLTSIEAFHDATSKSEGYYGEPLLRENDAEHISNDPEILSVSPVDLVVTSPPYPGIHLLYHRWQIRGRKETDAPYWIAACTDGAGTAFYNFADRREYAEDRYFEKAARSFAAIRRVMRPGALLVQLLSFSRPERQLRRYLRMMIDAGFAELREPGQRRVWRDVPGRKWHAASKGRLPSSREVALIHEAV